MLRRIQTAFVLVLVLVAAALGCGGDGSREGVPTAPTETDAAGTATVDEETAECENEAAGYRLQHPADWHTNEGDVLPPCSLFDPEPIEVEEGTEVPLDIAVMVSAEPVPFERAAAESLAERVVDRRETTVGGRRAVRLEVEATGEGLVPEGVQSTRYVVDLDGNVLSAVAYDVGEPAYETKQDVLAQMVSSLSFTGEARCSASEAPELEPQERLPAAVAEKRAAIAAAAADCDYDRLEQLAGDDLSYSFGKSGDFAGFLRREELQGREPLRLLVALLDRPHATLESEDAVQYVWPSAFAYGNWQDVPVAEREALKPLYDEDDFADFEQFGGYVGYRVGIRDDGEWLFFVAGD